MAVGVGLYITGVTWFARTKRTAEQSLCPGRREPGDGGGIGDTRVFSVAADDALELAWTPLYREIGTRWYVLWGLLGLLILRRPAAAIAEPTPRRVQLAVKECILSLIIIDAVACYAVRGVPWAIVILTLLVPTLVLGRWIYST